ncbi:MAG: dihydroneopterin aldolase [Actinomycetota bacterium]|nr:dihydroneopterin aldolase [Actinomycetota bacterium]
MDSIKIEGLWVETHIGATEAERAEVQPVLLDLEIEADLRTASTSDELEDTIDYAQVTTLVAELVAEKNVKLLEHLAGEIAEAVLALQGVRAVSVQIAKETPPVGENVRNIAVRIERSRS